MPVKIAEFDKTYIRDTYIKTPDTKTIKKLAKEYGVGFGDITFVLGKEADPIREENKQLEIDANIRQREQRQEKRWEKKDKQKYVEETLPDKTVWRCVGIPVGKDFKRGTGIYTEGNWKNIIMPEIHHLENSTIMRLNTQLIRMAHDSEYVSRFSEKHGYPTKLLDTHSRSTMPSLASSIIRGIKIKEDVLTVQVSGYSMNCGKCHIPLNNERICPKCGKLGGKTAGGARIKTIKDKSFLLVGNELIFELYIHPDNDEDKYYKKLLERLKSRTSLNLKIKDERKWGRGFQLYITGIRDIPETYYSGKPTILVFKPRVRLGIGAIECLIYQNGQQIKKMTPYHLNWGTLKHLDSESKSGKIRSWIHHALDEVWIYLERNNLFDHQPIALWLDVNDDHSHKEIRTWLSEGKFYNTLADKLSYRKGRLLKIPYQDLNSVMADLDVAVPHQET